MSPSRPGEVGADRICHEVIELAATGFYKWGNKKRTEILSPFHL